MNLQTAFTAAKSALLVNATQTALVSRNIAGASESGYSRRLSLVESSGPSGIRTIGVERATDLALQNAMLAAQSAGANDSKLIDAFDALHQTVGDPASGRSPATLIGSLNSSLIQAASAPQNQTGLIAAIEVAKKLANALNAGSAAVQKLRGQADSETASAVDKINTLLSQFGELSATISLGRKSGADISDALDRRDAVLSDLSQQIGIATISGPDGEMAVYADGGATLFQGSARAVTFQATSNFAPGVSGNAVYVDGVAVTGPAAAMPIQSGALAGLSQVRDVVTTKFQTQLDETARGLIQAFRQTEQSGSVSQSSRTGLFTWAGAPALPQDQIIGLSAQIAVDPSVDVSVGGDATLLRDGGIGAAGQSAFISNTTGSAAFSARLTALTDALGAPWSFASDAGLPDRVSVTDFATASIGWLEAGRQAASDAATESSALSTQASVARSNATGVNIDDQMSRMLDLENSYQAAAKVMATVDAMYTVLFNAMPVNA